MKNYFEIQRKAAREYKERVYRSTSKAQGIIERYNLHGLLLPTGAPGVSEGTVWDNDIRRWVPGGIRLYWSVGKDRTEVAIQAMLHSGLDWKLTQREVQIGTLWSTWRADVEDCILNMSTGEDAHPGDRFGNCVVEEEEEVTYEERNVTYKLVCH
jgi:hypothetical protein